MKNIPSIIAALITDDVNETKRFHASVAIVRHNDRWLLGLSKSRDHRYFKWCHPGGGIETGETPEKAAIRECHEETNARCKAIGPVFTHISAPGVAFVPCALIKKPNLISKADEFVSLGLFTKREIKKLRNVFHNVEDLIKIAEKYR